MFIKILSTCSDFDRTLRRRRLLAFALLLLGLLGVVCYFLLVNGSDALPDFAQGFYLGASSGVCLGAVILLVRVTCLIADPEARKKARIKEQDERERTILGQAFQLAGYVTFFGSAAALLVAVALNMAVALTLLAVLAVYALSWLFANLYFSKKL